MTNSEINKLLAQDYYERFRSIWKGSETKLTDEVSLFSCGNENEPILLFIISSIHGNERSGPIALMHYAERLAKRPPKYGRIVVVPIMNPTAWDLNERAPNSLNMNRIWSPKNSKRAKQVQKVMKILKNDPPLWYLDMHEDEVISDGQHYIFRNIDSDLGRELQYKTEVSIRKGIYTDHDYETSESYAHSLGITNSFTTETDPSRPMRDRVNFQLKTINESLKLIKKLRATQEGP